VPTLIDVHRLDRIDWDFPGAGTSPQSIHALHWFPGNFIPQIPTALVQVLSEPGQIVFDPFGGSGTTAVEALSLGRRAIVSDRMSVCILIASAKLALLGGALGRDVRERLLDQLTFDHECRSNDLGLQGEGGAQELRGWFSSDTMAQLRYLWKLIESQRSLADRKALMALFSDVLFDCAAPGVAVTRTGRRRRHHWGWVADNVRPRILAQHDAIGRFRQRLASLGDAQWGSNRLGLRALEASTTLVLQQDARKLALSNNAIDLIVTSPPYVSVIDYTSANRLLYAWMRWPMSYERADEIGARFRRKRKHVIDEYLSDMQLCRDEMCRVLRPGSFCAVVLGESKRFPDVAERVLRDFEILMPIIWGPVPRNPSRRRVSDQAARAPVELVCIFRKP
jgi:DNA modification methylase